MLELIFLLEIMNRVLPLVGHQWRVLWGLLCGVGCICVGGDREGNHDNLWSGLMPVTVYYWFALAGTLLPGLWVGQKG